LKLPQRRVFAYSVGEWRWHQKGRFFLRFLATLRKDEGGDTSMVQWRTMEYYRGGITSRARAAFIRGLGREEKEGPMEGRK